MSPPGPPPPLAHDDVPAAPRAGAGGYVGALAATAAVTGLAHLVFPTLDAANVVMLYLLGIVPVALRLGRGPAVVAVIASVLAFDWFFVPPYWSFAVGDLQYLVTFLVMLMVGLVIAELMSRLQHEARIARAREARATSLYALARALAAAPAVEQVAEAAADAARTTLGGRCAVLVLGEDDALVAHGPAPIPHVASVAKEVLASGARRVAGGVAYLPLVAPMRTRGVLVFDAPAAGLEVLETTRFAETFATLVAIALERVHYVDVAQRTLLGMESERLRNSLLAAVSHDLRTPLTVLVGLADSLRIGPSDAGAARTAGAIRDQARRMAQLVENLLEMARFQADGVRLAREWQAIEELVGAALDALDPVLAGHQVDVALPAALPLVRCDAVLIERVLVNLVENAVKHTPTGTRVTIGAGVEGDALAVTVRDAGPGLPPGRERHIFEKFARGDAESAVPGVGLGLAIARTIVEAHGGSIRAGNAPGGGAEFVFTLPLEAAPAGGAPDVPAGEVRS
jgi:two-component system sensor histidine kinase KdpD